MEPLHIRLTELLSKKKNGSRSALSRFCGVTPQAAQQWLDGTTTPRGKRLSKIAEYFEVPEIELVYGKQPEVDSIRKKTGGRSGPDIAAAFERLDANQKKAIITMLEAYDAL